MNDKTTREKIHDIIDAIIIDGNEADMGFMDRINDELGNPYDGQTVDAQSSKALIKKYIDNLLDESKDRI